MDNVRNFWLIKFINDIIVFYIRLYIVIYILKDSGNQVVAGSQKVVYINRKVDGKSFHLKDKRTYVGMRSLHYFFYAGTYISSLEMYLNITNVRNSCWNFNTGVGIIWTNFHTSSKSDDRLSSSTHSPCVCLN